MALETQPDSILNHLHRYEISRASEVSVVDGSRHPQSFFAKLVAFETGLVDVLSVESVHISEREEARELVRVRKNIAKIIYDLTKKAAFDMDAVVSANELFKDDVLVSFEDGGLYAQISIDGYVEQLDDVGALRDRAAGIDLGHARRGERGCGGCVRIGRGGSAATVAFG